MVLMILGGNAWAGWFSFEPNMVLKDGTHVALSFGDIEKENAYLRKGDTAKAEQLVNDEKVYIIKTGRDQTRVKFLDYKEHNGSIFVHVKDESGTKLWANLSGLTCECDQAGKPREVTKKDVLKGKFAPLSKVTQ
jgi:hypothetical protein